MGTKTVARANALVLGSAPRKRQPYALLSVYNKHGIVEFAKELTQLGFKIIASGGTYKVLRLAGLRKLLNTSTLVGGGAILGHKVVTLSRELHAGLLGDLEIELQEMEALGIPYIDLVCVDTYPLEEAIAKPDATQASVLQQTDIGGPAMLRSGAKGNRIVICEHDDRNRVITWLQEGRPDEAEFVNELAAKAEGYVAQYCLKSAEFRSGGTITGFIGKQVSILRYGENAAQAPAGLYELPTEDPLALSRFKVLGGGVLGFNNWRDLDRLLQSITHLTAAWNTLGLDPFIAVGVKHGNACGTACGEVASATLSAMLEGDPRAIFGGAIITNWQINDRLAALIVHRNGGNGKPNLDLVVAPDITDEAMAMLSRPGSRCKFVTNLALATLSTESLDTAPRFQMVRGGFLKQPNYTYVLDLKDVWLEKIRKATKQQETDLLIAWAICATSNSNTITLVKNGQLIGNGTGQQDRVGACELAVKRAVDAGHDTNGAVACSDSFFPFQDAVEVLHRAGIKAVFSTTGSQNDTIIQQYCRDNGIALYQLPDSIARGFFGH